MPLPDLNSLNPQVLESYTSERKFPLRPIIIILVAVLLLGGGFYLFNRFNTKSNTQNSQNQANQNPPTPGVIAKVGEELIYQKDLDIELAAYPPTIPLEERKKSILNKLATDSAILQGALAHKIIDGLDPSIYNSPDKDYLKRIRTINQVKSEVNKKAASIKGTIVALWFNNVKPGPIGYEKGKELAGKKMTEIYSRVKNKQLTVDQAVDEIINDPTLAQVDPIYQANARYNFMNTQDNPQIIFDKSFSDQLWNLKPGEISNLELLKDQSGSNDLIDSVYMFGIVETKTSKSSIPGLEQWIKEQVNTYSLQLYEQD